MQMICQDTASWILPQTESWPCISDYDRAIAQDHLTLQGGEGRLNAVHEVKRCDSSTRSIDRQIPIST